MGTIEKVISIIAAGLLMAFTAIILGDVVCRYWLKISLNWAAESCILLFQWTVFLGAALAVRKRAHFALDLVVRRFSPGARRAFEAGTLLVLAAAAVLLVIVGVEMTRRSWPSHYPTLPFSHGVAYLGVPVSAALMLVFIVEHLVAFLRASHGEGAAR
jgi:TRAP-type C4-dicarboxylate transport system permease small subunit